MSSCLHSFWHLLPNAVQPLRHMLQLAMTGLSTLWWSVLANGRHPPDTRTLCRASPWRRPDPQVRAGGRLHRQNGQLFGRILQASFYGPLSLEFQRRQAARYHGSGFLCQAVSRLGSFLKFLVAPVAPTLRAGSPVFVCQSATENLSQVTSSVERSLG